jgi:hypothetical protein
MKQFVSFQNCLGVLSRLCPGIDYNTFSRCCCEFSGPASLDAVVPVDFEQQSCDLEPHQRSSRSTPNFDRHATSDCADCRVYVLIASGASSRLYHTEPTAAATSRDDYRAQDSDKRNVVWFKVEVEGY